MHETEHALLAALQVDGRGNALLDFDDPNLPSLLAMPLLGFDGYDTEV
jgi:meiotically up-regulated gene 157 (Mug157) protein